MRSWFGRLAGRRRLERELDAELRDHVERQVADYVGGGLSEVEARRRVALEFGGIEGVKEACRDTRGTRWLHDLAQDVRYGCRVLARTPAFTAVAMLSLALGIGANTAIFSLINTVLLRSLPVREPERLVRVSHGSWTNPIWEQIRARQSELFDGAAAYGADTFDLAAGGPAERADGLWVSGGFFDVLGVPTVLGRTFTPEDDRRGGGPDGPVAVISYRFWQRHFGGARDIVGRPLRVNRVSYTIIGVTAPGFSGPVVGRSFDVAVPIGTEPIVNGAESWLDQRSSWWLEIMARLGPGQTIEEATRALRGAQPQIRNATLPDWPPHELRQYLGEPFELESAASGAPQFRERYRQPLLIMMVTVGLVLLIACANIANLMLARATARQHELSLRRAIGASASRLARQLLTESLLLAVSGAALGLLFARWAGRVLVNELSTFEEQVVLNVPIDWRVLAFTSAVAIGTALVFGLVPAVRAARAEPSAALKDQMRTIAGDRRRILGQPLVVLQVALSLVLIVAAGLFVRTLVTLTHQELGFDADRLLLVGVDVGRTRVARADRPALYERIEAAVRRVPGVADAALSALPPVSWRGWNDFVEVPGGAAVTGRDRLVWFNAVTPGWFATYGTTVLAGRDFGPADRDGAPLVAIVNQAFAAKYLPGANPIGRVIRKVGVGEHDNPVPLLQIVGLVQSTPYNELRKGTPPIVYVPLVQSSMDNASQTLTVRAAVSRPLLLSKAVNEAIVSVDPSVSLTFHPMAEQIDDVLVRERMIALLSGSVGVLALLLAGVGLYGVTSYGVSRRRTELGVRLALGAHAAAVVRLVLARVAVVVGLGIAAGAAVSLWVSRLVRNLLFGLEPDDPATLAGAILVLTAVAFLAAWLPARRAARIDPVQVLREG